VIEEKNKTNSFYKNWIDILPNTPKHFPNFFSDHELELLNGCLIKEMITPYNDVI